MIDPQVVQRLRANRDWAAIQEHIMSAIVSLDSVQGIERASAEMVAATVIGRQNVITILKEILRPFIDFREQADASELAREKAEDTGL